MPATQSERSRRRQATIVDATKSKRVPGEVTPAVVKDEPGPGPDLSMSSVSSSNANDWKNEVGLADGVKSEEVNDLESKDSEVAYCKKTVVGDDPEPGSTTGMTSLSSTSQDPKEIPCALLSDSNGQASDVDEAKKSDNGSESPIENIAFDLENVHLSTQFDGSQEVMLIEQQPREDVLARIDREIMEIRRSGALTDNLDKIEKYKLELASDDSTADNAAVISKTKSIILNAFDITTPNFFDAYKVIKSRMFRLRAVANRYNNDPSMEEIDKSIATADPHTTFWAALDAYMKEKSASLPINVDHLPITDSYRARPRVDHKYSSYLETEKFIREYLLAQRRESLYRHGDPSSLMDEEMEVWSSLISVLSRYPAAIDGRHLGEKLEILHLVLDAVISFRAAIMAEYEARLHVSKLLKGKKY